MWVSPHPDIIKATYKRHKLFQSPFNSYLNTYSKSHIMAVKLNRASQSAVFNSGQEMALRAFYFIRTLTKALTYY